MLILIQVIAIQLHGKFTAFLMVYSYIPATSYTEIILLGNDMY